MTSRFGRYAAAMTFLALGACSGGAQSNRSAQNSGSAQEGDSARRADTTEGGGRELDIAQLGFNWGSHDAPVRIVEMSDYGCGYCRKFHLETWPVLSKEFVEAGKIEWKFLPFVTGMFRNSAQATTAAECALEQGREQFEALNHRIWQDQREWKGSSDAAAVLRGWAAELGLDTARYATCVSEDRRGARIAAANALSRQIGVRGTPTFFIAGYPPLQGALPTESFRQVLSLVYRDATKDAGG